MSEDLVSELAQRALQLSPQDRARLAEKLLASVHSLSSKAEDPAFDEEIRRRVEEIESGAAVLVPAEEVFAEVRRTLR